MVAAARDTVHTLFWSVAVLHLFVSPCFSHCSACAIVSSCRLYWRCFSACVDCRGGAPLGVLVGVNSSFFSSSCSALWLAEGEQAVYAAADPVRTLPLSFQPCSRIDIGRRIHLQPDHRPCCTAPPDPDTLQQPPPVIPTLSNCCSVRASSYMSGQPDVATTPASSGDERESGDVKPRQNVTCRVSEGSYVQRK